VASQDRDDANDRRPAAERAYRVLRRQILDCELEPGSQLREAAVADRTGFGRTPVREALQRLVREGLVEVRARQGYRVTPITLDDVQHVFELRLVLEPMAVELAIARSSDQELAALRPLAEATHRTTEGGTYERYLTGHLAFHMAIAERSGNPRLARAIHELLAERQRLAFLVARSRRRDAEPEVEHHDLYDAIVERDTERAKRIVVEQIELHRKRVIDALVARLLGDSVQSTRVDLASDRQRNVRSETAT
jgi:DNA-binding GntR family transcriptional regulator